jgi:predicted Zn-dependent peptidase
MEIKKGVNVKVFNTDKFGVTTLCLLLRRNLCREEATKNALLSAVLEDGTAKSDGWRNFNIFTEENNIDYKSDIIKKGEQQIIELYLRFDKKNVEIVFELLGDIFHNPPITENVISRKKEVIAKIIRSRQNDKKLYARERCIEIMCEGEPFSVSGDGYEEDLDYITTENMKRHFADVVNTSMVDIIVVGNITENEISTLTEKYLPFNDRENSIQPAEYKCAKKAIKEVREVSDVVQTRLCIGIRTNISPVGEEWIESVVANEIFGGSSNSLLFSAMREEEGLCYYVSSILYRYKGLMVIQAGINGKNVDKSVSVIKKAFANVKKCEFNVDMVKDAVNSVADRYMMSTDSSAEIMDYHLNCLIAGEEMSLTEISEKTKNIANKFLNEALNKVLNKSFIDTIFVLEG